MGCAWMWLWGYNAVSFMAKKNHEQDFLIQHIAVENICQPDVFHMPDREGQCYAR